MKLNTAFLFLCLIISITSEIDLDSYSIVPFKEYLQKEGLFAIIESILKAYNQDVAILSCEELTESRKGNCKKLVIEYMDPSNECLPPNDCSKANARYPEIKCIEKLIYDKIIISKDIKDIKDLFVIKIELKKKFDENQSNSKFKKILNKIRQIGPCLE